MLHVCQENMQWPGWVYKTSQVSHLLTVLNSSINFYIYIGKQGVAELFNCDTSLTSNRQRQSELEETELVGSYSLVNLSQLYRVNMSIISRL